MEKAAEQSAADVVTRILSVFPDGSTAPCLVETASGEQWVMKLSGAGPGPAALMTEFLASRMALKAGLNVPSVRALFLPPDFPWQVGTDEFDATVQRSAGWNLGLTFVAHAGPVRADELDQLPQEFLSCLGALDRLLQNVDRTRANPNLLRDPEGRLWAIDHNACLFLDRIARRRPFQFPVPSGHFLASQPLSPAGVSQVVAALDRAFLISCVAEAPAAWLDAVGVARDHLGDRLLRYLLAFGELADEPAAALF